MPESSCTCSVCQSEWMAAEITRLNQQLDVAAKLLDQMAAALQSVEHNVVQEGVCPWCFTYECYGSNHKPDCPRELALAAYEAWRKGNTGT